MTTEDIRSSDGTFGLCPVCRSDPTEILNVERLHVAYCAQCKTKWDVGQNMFSSWRHEQAATWQRNAATLNSMRHVHAHYPPAVRGLDVETLADLWDLA